MTVFTRHRRLQSALVIVAVLAGIVMAAIPSTALTGTNFESGDGNLAVNTAGNKDWANIGIVCDTVTPANAVGCAIDKPTGQTDDSFGQGTKEDTAVPTVVSGSIPNNKSDLTRFYVAHDKGTNGDDFVYLAWERVQEPTGTTNMDFEFNQSSTTSSNGVTPARTAGDLLVKYDLSQGGTTPTLGYHVWVTAASAPTGATPASTCEANNSFPCWDKVHSLSGYADGSVNTANVTDPINPGAPRTLSPYTFGEAAIDLTASGIFTAGQCESFGAAYLKSRSSDSFTAAVKDFIAPLPVNISNCGGLAVKKFLDRNDNHALDAGESTPAGWEFTVTGPGPSTDVVCSGQTDSTGTLVCGSGTPPAGTTYVGTSTTLNNLAPGTYTVTETQQTGFVNSVRLVDTTATNTSNDTVASPSQTVTIAVGDSKTVTFGNACYVAATYSVTGVPTGQTPTIWYSLNGGTTQTSLTTSLKTGTTDTYEATASGVFLAGTSVTWGYTVNGLSRTVATYSTSSSGACTDTKTITFATGSVAGLKYFDKDLSGTKEAGEQGLPGFYFELVNGSSTVVATSQSCATVGTGCSAVGAFIFTSVNPGTYTIREKSTGQPAGWFQTGPKVGTTVTNSVTATVDAGGGVTYAFNGSSITQPLFGNAPYTQIQVNVLPQAKLPPYGSTDADATKATSISCTPTGGSAAGTTTSNTYTTGNLKTDQSSVTCVISFGNS